MFLGSSKSKQIWFSLGLLTFFMLFKPTVSTNNSLSPDSVRLYHDIVSGHGLYNGFTKLTELGGSNFQHVVFGNETKKLWLVEFYNSWCGHCHKFAPTWKALASDVYEWRNHIKIGVVECTPNPELCKKLEVYKWPTIRLFPPHSDSTFIGEHFSKAEQPEVLRVNLVKRFKQYHIHQSVLSETVNLKPVANIHHLDEILTIYFSSNVVYVVLVFEEKDSTAGAELALDLSRTEEVRVLSVSSRNSNQFDKFGIKNKSNGVVVINRNQTVSNLNVDHPTRLSLNKAAREFLVRNGIDISINLPPVVVPDEVEVNSSDIAKILDEIKRKFNISDLSTAVFKNDLLSAVRYSLINEIAIRKSISGAELSALKNYLHVLIKYLPSSQKEEEFLRKLRTGIGQKTQITGEDFSKACQQLEKKYKIFLPAQSWIGCMGSSSKFRGYPCGLWTLFHTLVVQEKVKGLDNAEKPEVLDAMVGYIKYFFTCSECVAHFAGMAQSIAGNVTTRTDSVLWLWAAHNVVNKRLAGHESEDPANKKIQFPSKEACHLCRVNGDTWNEAEVLSFLVKMYTNIYYIDIDDYPTTTTQRPTTKPVKPVIGFHWSYVIQPYLFQTYSYV